MSQPTEHVLLQGISWSTYETLLAELEAAHQHARLTYDHGDLEILARSFRHERFKKLTGRLVATLTEELAIPMESGGSTTLKSVRLEKGLDPDGCYWIANEAKVRGKDFLCEQDPPPDLAVEIEVVPSTLSRFTVYAALGVREIWLWKDRLTFHGLVEGDYREIEKSLSFPRLGPEPLTRFLLEAHEADETTWIRKFRAWVRDELSL